MSVLTPLWRSDCCIDSSRDCSRVNCVLLELDRGLVEPGLIQFMRQTFKSTAFTSSYIWTRSETIYWRIYMDNIWNSILENIYGQYLKLYIGKYIWTITETLYWKIYMGNIWNYRLENIYGPWASNEKLGRHFMIYTLNSSKHPIFRLCKGKVNTKLEF